MKKMMMVCALAVAAVAVADGDVDALKAALEKVSDAETQFRIGVCYAEGKGLVKDEKEAVRWYRKAAANGMDKVPEVMDAIRKLEKRD